VKDGEILFRAKSSAALRMALPDKVALGETGIKQGRRSSCRNGVLPVIRRLASGVAPALNQHVEDLTLVVDGTPEAHPLAGDPDHDLAQIPSVSRPMTTPS